MEPVGTSPREPPETTTVICVVVPAMALRVVCAATTVLVSTFCARALAVNHASNVTPDPCVVFTCPGLSVHLTPDVQFVGTHAQLFPTGWLTTSSREPYRSNAQPRIPMLCLYR